MRRRTWTSISSPAATRSPPLRVIVGLYAAGDASDAWMVAEEALDAFPAEAQLWSVAAQLRLAVGQLGTCADACRRAFELEPRAPGPRLTAALLHALCGEADKARALFEDAARRGAPSTVVAGLARAAGCRLGPPQR